MTPQQVLTTPPPAMHDIERENAQSIAAAEKKNANVVIIDPSKMVDPEGRLIDLEDKKAVRRWLREIYQGRRVTIEDDGQVVLFSGRGLDDDVYKCRGTARRQTYANLDGVVENSIYHSYEYGDDRHPYVIMHKTYYGAVDIGLELYATRIKVDVYDDVEDGLYKDLDIVKIKTPPGTVADGLDGRPTIYADGATSLVSLPAIKQAFDRTSNKISDSAPEINSKNKKNEKKSKNSPGDAP